MSETLKILGGWAIFAALIAGLGRLVGVNWGPVALGAYYLPLGYLVVRNSLRPQA